MRAGFTAVGTGRSRQRWRWTAAVVMAMVTASCAGTSNRFTIAPTVGPATVEATPMSGMLSPTPTAPSASPTAASPSPTDPPSPKPGSTAPGPTLVPTPPPLAYQPGPIRIDGFAQVLVTNLVVRERPFVGHASTILQQRPDLGDRLFVVDGPEAGSGYVWYLVRLADESATIGWVAAGSRQGEPWLLGQVPTCPDLPLGIETLLALDSVERLACFGRRDLTLDVIKRGPYEDAWGDMPVGSPAWLNDSTDNSSVGAPTSSTYAAAELPVRFLPGVPLPPAMRDRSGPILDPVYRITGHFDDPAARTCRSIIFDPGTGVERAVPVVGVVLDCRLRLVITSWVALHRVVPGETMSTIAADNGVTLQELFAANPQITVPALIRPGETVLIPGGAAVP